MSDPDDLHDDQIEAMCRSFLSSPEADALRRSVFAQTSRVLRRRRIVRRAGWTMAFCCCYFAGMATMSLIGHFRDSEPPIAVAPPAEVSPPAPRPTIEPAKNELQEEPGTRVARIPPTTTRAHSSFEVLREAGDRSLHERGDLRGALTYYRQAVKQASPKELEISTAHDNWLLQSLKQDRLQEVRNDKRNG